MEVVVGAYEELVLGYRLVDHDGEFSLEASFNDHSHLGCVKCMAISKRGILASGSSDEMIRLFNLWTRRDLGNLLHHTGSVTSVQFFGKKFMFTTSEDGTIGVWRVGRWECLRTLRGHKDYVYALAVHPSGKMALSVSKDKTLRTWNLMTGKCAYTTALKTMADLILWTPSGDQYLIITNNVIDVYKVETGKIHQTIKSDKRIAAAVYLSDSVLAVSGEGGTIHLFNVPENKHISEFETETTRVRGMVVCESHDGDRRWLSTASSDGFLKVYRIQQDDEEWKLTCDASINTKFRLTCIAATPTLVKEQDMEEEVASEEEGEEELSVPDSTDKPAPRVTVQMDSDEEEEDSDSEPEAHTSETSLTQRKGKSKNGIEKSSKKNRNRKRKLGAKVTAAEPASSQKSNKFKNSSDGKKKKKMKLF